MMVNDGGSCGGGGGSLSSSSSTDASTALFFAVIQSVKKEEKEEHKVHCAHILREKCQTPLLSIQKALNVLSSKNASISKKIHKKI